MYQAWSNPILFSARFDNLKLNCINIVFTCVWLILLLIMLLEYFEILKYQVKSVFVYY